MSGRVTVEMPADELEALRDLLQEMPIRLALETMLELRAQLAERVAEADRAIAELRRRALRVGGAV